MISTKPFAKPVIEVSQPNVTLSVSRQNFGATLGNHVERRGTRSNLPTATSARQNLQDRLTTAIDPQTSSIKTPDAHSFWSAITQQNPHDTTNINLPHPHVQDAQSTHLDPVSNLEHLITGQQGSLGVFDGIRNAINHVFLDGNNLRADVNFDHQVINGVVSQTKTHDSSNAQRPTAERQLEAVNATLDSYTQMRTRIDTAHAQLRSLLNSAGVDLTQLNTHGLTTEGIQHAESHIADTRSKVQSEITQLIDPSKGLHAELNSAGVTVDTNSLTNSKAIEALIQQVNGVSIVGANLQGKNHLLAKLANLKNTHQFAETLNNYKVDIAEVRAVADAHTANVANRQIQEFNRLNAEYEQHASILGQFMQHQDAFPLLRNAVESDGAMHWTKENLEKYISDSNTSLTDEQKAKLNSLLSTLKQLDNSYPGNEFLMYVKKDSSVRIDSSTGFYRKDTNGYQEYSPNKLTQLEGQLRTHIENSGLAALYTDYLKQLDASGVKPNYTPNTPADNAAKDAEIASLRQQLAAEQAKSGGGNQQELDRLKARIAELEGTDVAQENTKLQAKVKELEAAVNNAKEKVENWITKHPMWAIGGGVLGVILAFLGGMFVSNNNSSSQPQQQPSGAGAS